MQLDETVISAKNHTIDLSKQEGAVTISVLEELRGALHRNEMFHQINLADNDFNDDCVATISALMKDINFVVRYDLTNCNLMDKQVTLHLVPALLLKKRVTHLCLNKNPSLTDECIVAVCRLITETNLTDLSMIGASLTSEGGGTLLKSVVRSSILLTCKMPFGIGYKLLDAIEVHLDRNRTQFQTLNPNGTHGKSAVNTGPLVLASAGGGMRRQAMLMGPVNTNQVFKSPVVQKEQLKLAGPLSLPYIQDGTRDFKGLSPREASQKRLAKVTASRSMINSWADPTVTQTLVSLHMLTERSRLKEQAVKAGKLRISTKDCRKVKRREKQRVPLLPPLACS